MKDPRTRKRVRRRRQKIKKRQLDIQFNWFMSLIVMLLWSVFVFIVVYVEPALLKDVGLPGLYLPFFLSLFVAVFATVYLASKNLKRSWLISILLIIYMYLRLFNLGQWYNGGILLIVGLVVEYVWIGGFKKLKRLYRKTKKE